jgi:hypothetical protein
MNKQRKTRLVAGTVVGSVLGLASCAVQPTVADAIIHTITNFFIYFFITYLLVGQDRRYSRKRRTETKLPLDTG